MLAEFLAFNKAHSLLLSTDKVLLGISGGLDSVCLLHLLLEAGYQPALAHVNFKLRGDESDGDAELVSRLAQKYQLPLHQVELDAAQEARATGQSIQMAARNLRYQWFDSLRLEQGYTRVALAHQANDLNESLLLNLSRGTGLPGLKGMPRRRGAYVRPLLFAYRPQLLAYAREQNLSWREDSSNAKLVYKRNFVRHKLLPVMEELNPAVHQALSAATEQAAAAERLVLATLDHHPQVRSPQSNGIGLDLAYLSQLSEPELLLFYLLRPYGFGWQQARQILVTYQQATTPTGKQFNSNTHRALLNRHTLLVQEINAEEFSSEEVLLKDKVVAGPYQWRVRRVAAHNYAMANESSTAALDADLISAPLRLRRWQEGDRFVPLGMTGSKKISDFMIDRKIPLNLKSKVWVVSHQQDIVWVAGHRLDNRYRLSASTQTILEIRQLPL